MNHPQQCHGSIHTANALLHHCSWIYWRASSHLLLICLDYLKMHVKCFQCRISDNSTALSMLITGQAATATNKHRIRAPCVRIGLPLDSVVCLVELQHALPLQQTHAGCCGCCNHNHHRTRWHPCSHIRCWIVFEALFPLCMLHFGVLTVCVLFSLLAIQLSE